MYTPVTIWFNSQYWLCDLIQLDSSNVLNKICMKENDDWKFDLINKVADCSKAWGIIRKKKYAPQKYAKQRHTHQRYVCSKKLVTFDKNNIFLAVKNGGESIMLRGWLTVSGIGNAQVIIDWAGCPNYCTFLNDHLIFIYLSSTNIK